MEGQYLKYEKRGPAGILFFNNPKVLNALNSGTLDEMNQFLDKILMEKEIRALILTGEGKAYIAGADIGEMQNMTPGEARAFSLKGQALARRLETFPLPVIAAVNGFALGGGLEFVLCCDFAYASQKARLGFPETTLGIIPGFGGSKRLLDRVGKARAKELIFTGRILPAEEALAWGIVNKICEPETLLTEVLAVAEEMLKASPHAVAEAKKLLNKCPEHDTETMTDLEAEKFGLIFSHPDSREGKDAFLEKRKPEWRSYLNVEN